jgi:hypothetical protein
MYMFQSFTTKTLMEKIVIILKLAYITSFIIFCLIYYYSMLNDSRFGFILATICIILTIIFGLFTYRFVFKFKNSLKSVKKINTKYTNLDINTNSKNNILETKFAKTCRRINSIFILIFVNVLIIIGTFIECGINTIVSNCSNRFSYYIASFGIFFILMFCFNIIWLFALFDNKGARLSHHLLNLRILVFIIIFPTIAFLVLGYEFMYIFALLALALEIVFQMLVIINNSNDVIKFLSIKNIEHKSKKNNP